MENSNDIIEARNNLVESFRKMELALKAMSESTERFKEAIRIHDEAILKEFFIKKEDLR